MQSKKLLTVSGVVCFLFSLTFYAHGQVAGRLAGTVVDAAGAAIPGAKVTLRIRGGAAVAAETETNSAGNFSLLSLRPDYYDLVVEAKGFLAATVRDLKIDAAREASQIVQLNVDRIADAVRITSQPQVVQTSSAEIGNTVSADQIRQLPSNRDPMNFLNTQPGVLRISGGNRLPTINGQRAAFVNVSLDGVSTQDPFNRSAGLVRGANNLTISGVAEVTVSSSNSDSDTGGGSAFVSFVTPSGATRYHGGALWYNANSFFTANDWFNNRSGIPVNRQNNNQGVATLSGPALKDKLFFFANYELLRQRTQRSANRTILTNDARQGIFTYRDTAGTVRKVNVLQAVGATIDPVIKGLMDRVPGGDKINNYLVGDSSEAFLRNTAGYSFRQSNFTNRDTGAGKLDYVRSSQQSFSATYVGNTEEVDLGAATTDYSVVSPFVQPQSGNLVSLAWRWNPWQQLTNELRGGFNFLRNDSINSRDPGPYLLNLPAFFFNNPVLNSRNNGRNSQTYNIADNLSYLRGAHTMQFGAQFQIVRLETYNETGLLPAYTLAVGTGGNRGLTTAQLPGASAADVTNANSLLAGLAGYISTATQTFNVTSPTSGYVGNAPNRKNYSYDNYAFYAQDAWRLNQRLSLTLGLRYDYYTVFDENKSLALLPVIENGDVASTLLSNATLDFAGESVNHPFYQPDRNNFAPNIGLAWDVFGDGKLALRAAYTINYVNDEIFQALDSIVNTNSGLNTNVTLTRLAGAISAGLPALATPAYKTPRLFADNYALNAQAQFAMPDPNLRTPYVQQWSLGLQYDFKGTLFEARYIGNHSTKQLRVFDLNQIDITSNGFLDDFKRAQSNGNLARAANGVFNPNYNPAIPGSQPLTVFPKLANGGQLGNATIINLINTGQVGELARTYQTTRANGAVNFFPNPLAAGLLLMTNYSNARYDALQLEANRRLWRGVRFQASYVFSKALSDSSGGGSTRLEPLLDARNPRAERQRASFDLTHVFKFNGFWDLPLGTGHRLNVKGLGRALGGWNIGVVHYQHSGFPFSVLSGRGTLNSATRSASNTANTTLTRSQLNDLFQFRMTNVGPYFVAASAINPINGSAMSADGSAPFAGQVFFQPAAGTLGLLQRAQFSGPWVWQSDLKISKVTRITERHVIELRADIPNVFNHPTFTIGDQRIDGTSFGRITGNLYSRRQVNFTLQYRF